MSSSKFYTREEERANVLSHALGLAIGITGSYFLLSFAIRSGSTWAMASVTLYLAGMLFSYFTSTCYHACTREKRRETWRKLDHSAIYMHIAGTYAPFTLLVLRDVSGWGWSLFAVNTLAAITGTILSFRKLKDHSHLETICFIGMGCSILTAFRPLVGQLSLAGQIASLYWLVAGGISYIIGALFYSWKNRRYMHTVFHVFVVLGSICHMWAIYLIL
ncbi:MAG: hemolysin III family protein [Tannerellaceae bacterium]|nr:hemolysin III family protein [Tannerellaceae bacterium]MCC8199182.1 hemolysin III family protein [Tannerellaceae bacterium]